MRTKYPIAVPADAPLHSWNSLLRMLEGFFPVEFDTGGESGEPEGLLILREGRSGFTEFRSAGACSLSVPYGGSKPNASGRQEVDIRFSDLPEVPFPFRNRSLHTSVAIDVNPLPVVPGELVLASCDSGPLWGVSETGGVTKFRSAFAPPAIPKAGCLLDVLGNGRFMELLPVLHWLRTLCAAEIFEPPPARACFVFDDPNLHWPRYGYVDFEKIALHALKHGYHVSFAMVPLDTWFTHRETAGIFREHRERLSLSIHGNNHTRRELARAYSQRERLLLLRQAVHRIEHFERQSGISVSRVIVPPHGAISEETLTALPGSGFDAACNSHGSLRANNRNAAWTESLGFLPGERIHGCPVLPRWGLSGPVTNTILLAAYLGQPVILRGHHRDLKDGVEVLDELARFINSLGPVSWKSLSDLSRMNYQCRVDGGTLRIAPLGNRVMIPLPRDISRISIKDTDGDSPRQWKVSLGAGPALTAWSGADIPIPQTSCGSVSLETSTFARAEVNGSPCPAPLAVARRLLAEARDRVFSW